MDALLDLAVPGRVANGLVAEPLASTPSAATDTWTAANRHRPDVAFFLERNPHHAEGACLPILVRLGGLDFAQTLARIVRIEAGRRLPHRGASK